MTQRISLGSLRPGVAFSAPAGFPVLVSLKIVATHNGDELEITWAAA
jgi:hypothetical protein